MGVRCSTLFNWLVEVGHYRVYYQSNLYAERARNEGLLGKQSIYIIFEGSLDADDP